MKVQITFTLDVDWVETGEDVLPGSLLAKRIEDTVAEGIAGAVQWGQANGFRHAMDAELSILVDSDIQAKLL